MDNTESIQDLLNQLQNIDTGQLDPELTQATLWTSGIWWWSWVIGLISLAATWVIFLKANKPGWAAIIPVYNTYVMLEVVGKPWWWLLLLLIPIVNIVFAILMMRELARVFGQGVAFTVGLIFLPFVFMPLLAWGNYKYTAPRA